MLFLGLVARNTVVAGAAGILLLLKLAHIEIAMHWLSRYGLSIGYVFLILAVLVPVALDRISWRDFTRDVVGLAGITAVVVGAAGSWMASHGVRYMDATPQALVPIVLGTIIGTALLRGVPNGPLIAAGVTAMVLRFIK